MASLSDDEILAAVARRIQTDRDYRRQLEVAVQSKNDSWVKRLIRSVVGDLIEVGQEVLAAITGWFTKHQPPW
jgi:hypothetical protein